LGTVKRRAEDNNRLQRTRNKVRGAEAQPLGGLKEWWWLPGESGLLIHGGTQFLGTRMTRFVDPPDLRSTN